MLRFLISEAMAGRGADLKEYNIGVAVFRRGDRFDPRTDSIVRVTAAQLRKKLDTYYQNDGVDDTVLIEIPKGRYVPDAHLRAIAPKIDTAPPDSEPFTKPEAAGPRGLPSLALSLVLLLGVLAAGLVLGMAIANRKRRIPPPEVRAASAAVPRWNSNPVWRGFFDPQLSTTLVIGTPFMFSFGHLLVRSTAINDASQLHNDPRVARMEEAFHASAHPYEAYTGIGEAVGTGALQRFFTSQGKDLHVLRNDLVRWSDLLNNNAIILSSMRFQTINYQLHLPSDFHLQVSNEENVNIYNAHPRPGEPSVYVWDGIDNDYAVITIWPGTSPGRRLMKISGCDTWATQGAAEMVTDPNSLLVLQQKLGQPPGKDPDQYGVQILVRVKVKAGQVVSTRYVTHHWLTRSLNQ